MFLCFTGLLRTAGHGMRKGWYCMKDEQLTEGRFVVYKSNGVCKIERTERMHVSGQAHNYYVLAPINKPDSIIYVPVDNPRLCSDIRGVLSQSEIRSMLTACRGRELCWNPDRKERATAFRDILAGGISIDLIGMVRCLYGRKHELEQQNKLLPAQDDTTLQTAERLVREEFAFALEIPEEKVASYIQDVIEPAM